MTVPSVEQSFTGEPASVAVARRFLRNTLTVWGAEGLIDPAVQVLSELATNSVIHARTSFKVQLTLEGDGALRLAVSDRSLRRPAMKSHSAEATTGRGLALVGSLAASWGVDMDGRGKAVWALLRAAPSRRHGKEPADARVDATPLAGEDPGEGPRSRAELSAA